MKRMYLLEKDLIADFNKKIKFFGAGYTASNVFWWIGFFIVIWLEYKGKNLNNVQNTIYYSIVFVLIIAGVVFKELQRHTAGEDTNKAMKSLTKAYIGIWGGNCRCLVYDLGNLFTA